MMLKLIKKPYCELQTKFMILERYFKFSLKTKIRTSLSFPTSIKTNLNIAKSCWYLKVPHLM